MTKPEDTNKKETIDEVMLYVLDRLLRVNPDLILTPDPELIKMADELTEGVLND